MVTIHMAFRVPIQKEGGSRRWKEMTDQDEHCSSHLASVRLILIKPGSLLAWVQLWRPKKF